MLSMTHGISKMNHYNAINDSLHLQNHYNAITIHLQNESPKLYHLASCSPKRTIRSQLLFFSSYRYTPSSETSLRRNILNVLFCRMSGFEPVAQCPLLRSCIPYMVFVDLSVHVGPHFRSGFPNLFPVWRATNAVSWWCCNYTVKKCFY